MVVAEPTYQPVAAALELAVARGEAIAMPAVPPPPRASRPDGRGRGRESVAREVRQMLMGDAAGPARPRLAALIAVSEVLGRPTALRGEDERL